MVDFWTNTLSVMNGRGLDQDRLADLAGISKNTLAGWIAKDRIPRADEAFRLAEILGTSVEFLLTGTEKERPRKAQLIADFLEKQIQDRKTFMKTLMDTE